MTDYGADWVVVADAVTPEGAEAVVALLKLRGIAARELMPVVRAWDDRTLFWPVEVPRRVAAPVRAFLREEVTSGRRLLELTSCPCGYSLEGLAGAEVCPECGTDLERVRREAGKVWIVEEGSGERPRRPLVGALVGGGLFLFVSGVAGGENGRSSEGAGLVCAIGLLVAFFGAVVWLRGKRWG